MGILSEKARFDVKFWIAAAMLAITASGITLKLGAILKSVQSIEDFSKEQVLTNTEIKSTLSSLVAIESYQDASISEVKQNIKENSDKISELSNNLR